MLEVERLEGLVEVDAEHRYWLDPGNGKDRLGPYPSVTRLIGTGRQYYKPEHANRGIRVHLACEMYDRIGECITEVDEGGYLEAWQGFLNDMGDRLHIIDIEVPFLARIWTGMVFGGTVDRIIRIDGETGVLDIKSGQPAPWHQAQVVAYAAPFEATVGLVVYIAKDGRYKVREHRDLYPQFLAWAGGLPCS